jgi:hypothetical protein
VPGEDESALTEALGLGRRDEDDEPVGDSAVSAEQAARLTTMIASAAERKDGRFMRGS